MKPTLNRKNLWPLCGVLLTAGIAQAQTAPPSTVTDPVTTQPNTQAALTEQHSLFTPETYTIDSAIEDRLDLTDEQRQQLKAAYEAVMAPVLKQHRIEDAETSRTVQEQRAIDKRQATQLAAADRELRRRYSTILTPQQNAIVREADSVTKSVVKEVGAVYAARINAADTEGKVKLEVERANMIQRVVQSRLDHRDSSYNPYESLLVSSQATEK